MYKYNLRIFAVILVALTSGCAHRLPVSPIKIPVSLIKTGTVVNMDFKVKRAYQYGFALVFVYNKNGKDEQYSLERDKLKKLVV